MSQTFAQLKSLVRSIVWPSGEASNLVAAHNKAFVDALIDLQTFVECLQIDNVSLFPQCSTLYNCGITVFDAPRGNIKKVSVIAAPKVSPPSGAIVLTGTFGPQITDSPSAPASLGVIPSSDLYIIETIGNGSACNQKGVPQYFSVLINYKLPDGTNGFLEKRVTLNDCQTDQTDQVNLAGNSPVYISILPFNIPVKNQPGSGSAAITINVRKYVSTDVLTPAADFCSEIEYKQIEPNYVQKYWNHARQRRCCPSIPFFFGLNSDDCGLHHYPPVPTDADVPAGLGILPLSYHYPQTDTDKKHRARVGLWAIERQKIYIAPWIDSNETVIVKWDGIKRAWADADFLDDDPLLIQAVTAYVRRDHFAYWDRDYEAAQAAGADYIEQRTKLVHQCREETRVRGDEPSFARASANVSISLFYNAEQSATASCPSGQTGASVTVTIPAGTVASSTSQADADTQAQQQAQQQAEARLNCQAPQTTYSNNPQSYTATCQATTGAPTPDGSPVTINIPAGAYTSVISQADADAQALAAATAQATAQLSCVWWNREQSYTAECPNDISITVTKTTAAHTISSTISQDDADAQALTAATNAANTAISCPGATLYYNTVQIVHLICPCPNSAAKKIALDVTVPANTFTSLTSQAEANQKAVNYGNAQLVASCAAMQSNPPPACGSITQPL